MADIVLVWHQNGTLRADKSIGPTYCLDADYEPVAVRIYAESAPSLNDASFDIMSTVEGVTESIFQNQTPTSDGATGRKATVTQTTTAILPKSANYEDHEEDFVPGLVLEQGTWVSCVLRNSGGGENFTISLELDKVE